MKTKPLPFKSMNPLQIKRFWDKVDKRSESECWPWMGAIKGKGYGNYAVNAVALGTSRVGWFIVHGKDPYPFHVLHSCDNRPCCNPAHWFLGTNDDNIADRINKGRSHGRREWKLTPQQARQIKHMLIDKIPQSKIAATFGVSQATVSRLNRGICYRSA